jgi:hypothetical protein
MIQTDRHTYIYIHTQGWTLPGRSCLYFRESISTKVSTSYASDRAVAMLELQIGAKVHWLARWAEKGKPLERVSRSSRNASHWAPTTHFDGHRCEQGMRRRTRHCMLRWIRHESTCCHRSQTRPKQSQLGWLHPARHLGQHEGGLRKARCLWAYILREYVSDESAHAKPSKRCRK